MNLNKTVHIAFIVLAIGACKNESKSDPTEMKTEIINGNTTSTFKVWGNCEMCKKTIEASLQVEGVTKADWNVDTKIITVVYDSSKITLDQIQNNIASVGYDNDKYKGSDKAYSELAGCCQYDRK